MYVVVNKCYGGFSLSVKGLYQYCIKKHGQAFLYEKENIDSNIARKVTYSDKCKDKFIYRVTATDEGDSIDVNEVDFIDYFCIDRTDPALVATVRELGEEANGTYSDLEIVEIPDDVKWHIEDYDGMESIHENHRVW